MPRFEFGKNWSRYLSQISDEDLAKAMASFQEFSEVQTLAGLRFLDVGCGSGIHSWVAHQLGAAQIVSFDRDKDSTETCRHLKAMRLPKVDSWVILEGDVLNKGFLSGLGTFDYVYAWGVLHHTGQMWNSMACATQAVKPGGRLHLALYNRHWTSPLWKTVKWAYSGAPSILQKMMFRTYSAWENAKGFIHRLCGGQESFRGRGMHWSHDLCDWLGGYPYEYASTQEVQDFLGQRGFRCLKVTANHGVGCSEYLFERTAV